MHTRKGSRRNRRVSRSYEPPDMIAVMATRERLADRGSRIGSRLRVMLGDELRNARIAAGLSLVAVGRTVDLSYSQVGRIERGVAPAVTVEQLARIGAVLGLDLTARLYPGGPRLRDAGQIALLGRFRASLHPRLTWRTEVPLPNAGDLRAWDGMVSGAGPPIGVEAEMRLIDAQAVDRRIALKQRDSGIERVILLLPPTRTNRRILTDARSALAERFPLGTRAVLTALRDGRDPGGNGIVIL